MLPIAVGVVDATESDLLSAIAIEVHEFERKEPSRMPILIDELAFRSENGYLLRPVPRMMAGYHDLSTVGARLLQKRHMRDSVGSADDFAAFELQLRPTWLERPSHRTVASETDQLRIVFSEIGRKVTIKELVLAVVVKIAEVSTQFGKAPRTSAFLLKRCRGELVKP
mgnify:CR=1 FL=1